MTILGQQAHHGLFQWHLVWVRNIASVDEERSCGSHKQVHEGCFEGGAEILAKDECLRVVGMHLEGRLRVGLAIFGSLIPADIQRAVCRLR